MYCDGLCCLLSLVPRVGAGFRPVCAHAAVAGAAKSSSSSGPQPQLAESSRFRLAGQDFPAEVSLPFLPQHSACQQLFCAGLWGLKWAGSRFEGSPARLNSGVRLQATAPAQPASFCSGRKAAVNAEAQRLPKASHPACRCQASGLPRCS